MASDVTLDKIVGLSQSALSVFHLGELQEIARDLWGTTPNVRKPELVRRIWEHVQTL